MQQICFMKTEWFPHKAFFQLKSVTKMSWTFLVVQWLRLHISTSRGTGSIPGQGTKIPHTAQRGKRKKKSLSSDLGT